LADFERRNAFEKVDVARYYIPLTAVGRVALRLGPHHRIIKCIPARSPSHSGTVSFLDKSLNRLRPGGIYVKEDIIRWMQGTLMWK
jgi:hypothetical protein